MKKITYIDGVPQETEEVTEVPCEEAEELAPESKEIIETITEEPIETKRTVRRVIKKIIYIDGVPQETEEVVEVPWEEAQQLAPESKEIIETITEEPIEMKRSVRRVIKKIIYIDGVPQETEEVIEVPWEEAEELAPESKEIIETITEEPKTKRTVRRVIKKIIYIDGVPQETEKVVEVPLNEGKEIGDEVEIHASDKLLGEHKDDIISYMETVETEEKLKADCIASERSPEYIPELVYERDVELQEDSSDVSRDPTESPVVSITQAKGDILLPSEETFKTIQNLDDTKDDKLKIIMEPQEVTKAEKVYVDTAEDLPEVLDIDAMELEKEVMKYVTQSSLERDISTKLVEPQESKATPEILVKDVPEADEEELKKPLRKQKSVRISESLNVTEYYPEETVELATKSEPTQEDDKPELEESLTEIGIVIPEEGKEGVLLKEPHYKAKVMDEISKLEEPTSPLTLPMQEPSHTLRGYSELEESEGLIEEKQPEFVSGEIPSLEESVHELDSGMTVDEYSELPTTVEYPLDKTDDTGETAELQPDFDKFVHESEDIEHKKPLSLMAEDISETPELQHDFDKVAQESECVEYEKSVPTITEERDKSPVITEQESEKEDSVPSKDTITKSKDIKAPIKDEEIIEEWIIITELLKRKETTLKDTSCPKVPTSVVIESLSQEPEGRKSKIEDELALLNEAINKDNVNLTQHIIINIIQEITLWIEETEHRIIIINNSKDPKERKKHHEQLQHELVMITETITILEEIITSSKIKLDKPSQDALQTSLEGLKAQVMRVDKVRNEQEEECNRADDMVEQCLLIVNDAGVQAANLKSKLLSLKEESISPKDKLKVLEDILSTNEDLRDSLRNLATSKDLNQMNIQQELASVQVELREIHDNVESELERIIKLTTTTAEYEETLNELGNLIEMAENVLNSRIVARDLPHLTATIRQHKKLFLSLRQCQKVLESLDMALEPQTRVHYQALYSKSYQKATSLLDKATQRHQQLSSIEQEWDRLLQLLEEEEQWSKVADKRNDELHTVCAEAYQQNTDECKDLLVASVQHEAHTGHLLSTARKLGESISCTSLETRVAAQHQNTTELRCGVYGLLNRLEELHVHWTAYQTQMDQLQEWSSQATVSLKQLNLNNDDQQQIKESFNQIWNLKAQFDSQNELLNDCLTHFDKSVGLVHMTDEELQRQYLNQFRSEWSELESLLHDKEHQLQRLRIQTVPTPQLLVETQDTISSIEVALQEIDTQVTSIQQLRNISEKYKILRIKILNSKDNLEHIREVANEGEEPDEEMQETIDQLTLTCQELVCTVQQRIASLEYVLDHVQKTVNRVERISLTMMHLENTLEKCKNIDKEGEQLLRAALHSCKTVYEGLSRAEEDIGRVRQCMETLRRDPHHPCHLQELEEQITQLVTRLESLSKNIEETKSNLQGRLESWQEYINSSDQVDQFLQEIEYLMESALDIPSVDIETLKKHVDDLQGLKGSMSTKEELLDELRQQAVHVEKEDSIETQIVRWNSVSDKLVQVIMRYETALHLWTRFASVQEDVSVWVDTKLSMVVKMQSEPVSEDHQSQIKVLVGEAKWSGERVAELRQLAEQIMLHVAEDTSKDTPLVAEVERLGYRINNLTEAIHALSDHLSKQPLTQKEPLKKVAKAVEEAEQLLQLPPPEPAHSLDRSQQLQSKLLSLGSSNGPPIDLDPAQSPVIETWKNALKNTHGRFEQVLAGLSADDEQLESAINSWRQYLDSVDEGLAAPIPASREGLLEAARLCQVHRSILNTQVSVLNTMNDQALKEDSPEKLRRLQSQLRNLILRHNKTISKVSEREKLLYSTLTTWETYRNKVAQIQSWILTLEQEKQGLQLRQVPQTRLLKVINRLQSLLDQLSKGEEQVEEVSNLCEQLISSCEETIHPILKAELNSIEHRVANLKAALETWLKYLKDISDLWNTYENLYNKLNSKLKELQCDLTLEKPNEFAKIQERISCHKNTVSDLESLTPELTAFRETREQMVDRLTPADLRIVTTRMWRLLQMQGELIHQYQMQINTLEDSLEMWQLYDTRYAQFMKWISAIESKIDGGSEQYIDSLIRKLEHEYQVEIGMKQIEKMWLVQEGEELLKTSNEEQTKEMESKINNVEEAWKNIIDKCKLKKQKLEDILTTINKTELTLTELKKWLFHIEKKLSSPVLFMTNSKKEIDKLLEEEDNISREIEKQSCNISSVLNLCEMVIRDCNEFEVNGETDSLQEASSYLEKRWGSICTRSAERKKFIKTTKKLWDELFRVHISFTSWLESMETRVGKVNALSTLTSYSSIEETLSQVHKLQREIHDQTKEYEDLNQKYRVLARPHGRENRLDQGNKIKEMVKLANLRFHSLNYFVSIIIKRLRYSQELWSEFQNGKESLTTWLNDLNSHISDTEQQVSMGDSDAQKRALIGLFVQYEENEPKLKIFEDLVQHLYQRSCYPDCQFVEDSLSDFISSKAVVQSRLNQLRESTLAESEELVKSAPAPQVFEEEQIIEEDFSYSLVPDSEIGTLDSTFDLALVGGVGGRSLAVELKAALEESKKLLLSLDEAIRTPTPQGVEVDKMYYTFSKQLAACRSSIDLLGSLSKQPSNDEEVHYLLPEVVEVIEEFRKLEDLAKEKQQRMKENSETSSLTCPLCCKRNWKQFENDMWRLEQWLSHSEASQSILHDPPRPIEELEEAAQDHREFLMDLDGHKSIIMSLNVIGRHLAEHTRDIRRAQGVRTRLDTANKRWEGVCLSASRWQGKLQAALMGNSEFHKTVLELLTWTEETEAVVHSVTVEEGDDEAALKEKVNRLLDIRAEAERCEPRVASLHQAAHHLLHTHDDEGCVTIRERLAILSQRLQLLLQICSQKLTLFSQRLGYDFTQSLASLASTGLYESSEFSLYQHTSPSVTASFHSVPNEDEDQGVVRRSYRFLGRVVRAALPIQALMLLMLGVASLMPSSEDDYACNMANSFARSLNPMLRHEGPPPY